MRALPAAEPGVPDLRSPRRFLLWVGRAQWPTLLGAALWGMAWMTSLASIPLLLGAGIEAAARRQPDLVLSWSAAILGAGVVAAIAGMMRHRRAVLNYLRAAACTQQLIIRQAARLGGDLPRQVAAGEVASLSATDVDRIGDVFDVFGRFAGSVLTYLAISGVLFWESPEFGLVALLGGPITLAALVIYLRPLGRRQTVQREATAVASGLAVDVVGGLRVLRGLGGESVFQGRFGVAAQSLRRAMARTMELVAVLRGLEVLVPGAFLVAVTLLGGRLAEVHQASAGQLVTVYAFAAFLIVPLSVFGQTAQLWSAGLVAAGRVLTVLRLERDLPWPEPEPGQSSPGLLAKEALFDSQTGVRVEPGLLTAITGEDSEALTSLADRLGRYAAPAPGESVELGAWSLSALPLERLRGTVMVVDREARLLAGRLGEGLDPHPEGRPGKGRPSLAACLRAADAREILSGLPGGLEYVVPERGRSLSGGQRQRLVLARALRADPPVLVLDEPTSAVDTHTEAVVVERLVQIRRGKTTVVLTTSPLMLERADRVLLLEGRVVASGSHQQLWEQQGRYRRMLERDPGR